MDKENKTANCAFEKCGPAAGFEDCLVNPKMQKMVSVYAVEHVSLSLRKHDPMIVMHEPEYQNKLAFVAFIIMRFFSIEAKLMVLVRHYLEVYTKQVKIETIEQAVVSIYTACRLSTKAFHDHFYLTDDWVRHMALLPLFSRTDQSCLHCIISDTENKMFKCLDYCVIPSQDVVQDLLQTAQERLD